MKTKIKTLIAFVMLSGALLPITFALPNAQSNTNAQTAPQVTVPGSVQPNDQGSGTTSRPNEGPRIDSKDASSRGAASGAVPSVPDTDVRLNGTVSYNHPGGASYVNLHVDDVANYASGGTSGTLKLQLWVTSTPYNGGNIQGYVVGEYILGTLPGGYHFYNVDVNVPFTSPPAGTWYVTMTLDEYQNPYVIVNWRTFSSTWTIGGGGGLQYFPFAYYVGGNWYWDNQIGYIYPYSNGVCYFYTYGRYYYPGAGSFGYSTGVYIYDYNYASWTYTSKSFWPWVYYYRFGQWYNSGFQ